MDKTLAEQLEVFGDYLREKGLRRTRQREMIVETFLKTEGHISTEELYRLVRRRGKRIGYTTVFRTLKALTDCGLARETDLADGRTRFEHLYKRLHHHHIVCVECSGTIEFFSPELERLQEKIVSRYHFRPVSSRFQIFGVCKGCQDQRKPRHESVDSDLVFARDALKIAIETENRGVNFYQTAADLVLRDETRKTFLRMLEDERHHLSGLQAEWNRLVKMNKKVLDAPVFLHFDYDALKRIFPSKDEIHRRLNLNLKEHEALKLAMQMEKDAFEFFSQYAEKFSDTKGREIFRKFAEEEYEHYTVIREAYEQLKGDRTT